MRARDLKKAKDHQLYTELRRRGHVIIGFNALDVSGHDVRLSDEDAQDILDGIGSTIEDVCIDRANNVIERAVREFLGTEEACEESTK